MLASNPARILNHKPLAQGIPYRFSQAVNRFRDAGCTRINGFAAKWLEVDWLADVVPREGEIAPMDNTAVTCTERRCRLWRSHGGRHLGAKRVEEASMLKTISAGLTALAVMT